MGESGEFARFEAEAPYAAALASLPLQTPMRLRRLITVGPPSLVWALVRAGERPVGGVPDDAWRAWRSARARTPEDLADACDACGATILTVGDPRYPRPLVGDPAAPAVLFARGDTSHLLRRRAGIVGTRSATRTGRHFARTLGGQLASEGVCVVSGLARGIDVESHAGALQNHNGAAPAAVVASGPDVVYPPEHARIWDEVGNRGVLLTEAPPGTPPEPHRFPMRNRVLAGLSEVLVVVESRRTGGSMITVREAAKRDVTVLAVPGSPGARSSEGTNELLRDGCGPVTSVDDVLVALGLDTRNSDGWCDTRRQPAADERCVLDAMGRGPRTVDEVAISASMSVVRAAVLLGRLEASGWVAQSEGWWEALRM